MRVHGNLVVDSVKMDLVDFGGAVDPFFASPGWAPDSQEAFHNLGDVLVERLGGGWIGLRERWNTVRVHEIHIFVCLGVALIVGNNGGGTDCFCGRVAVAG